MNRNKPDYKLKEANKVIANLDDSKESELIVYYINKKDEQIDSQKKRIKEYVQWFLTLNKFLPNHDKYYK